jgi:hypothetical protein
MMRYLLRCLAVLFSFAGSAAALLAQGGNAPIQVADPKVIDTTGVGSPLPYALAVVYTIIVLALICMPSRKGA